MRFATGIAAMPPAASRRLFAAWRLSVCLALFLFALRSLVPPGFMPDPDALRSGHFDMTFCTAQGAVNVPVDLSASHGKSGMPATAAADCPFGLAGNHTFVPPAPAPALLVLVLAERILYRFGGSILPFRHASGPPLGSRAPPASLY